MENHNFKWANQLFLWAIFHGFHGYVSYLPEGKPNILPTTHTVTSETSTALPDPVSAASKVTRARPEILAGDNWYPFIGYIYIYYIYILRIYIDIWIYHHIKPL